MSTTNYYIAVDLGAESGRVMLASLAQGKLKLEEMHRFPNGPVTQDGHFHWDMGSLMREIKTGVGKAVKACPGEVRSIAVDTWGVDYGLIDADGELIANPFHYRDSRTDDKMDEAFAKMSKREIYQHTGLQFMQLNSLYQLMAEKESNGEAFGKAEKIIFMADLVAYMLCGEAYAEYTLASTSQMMDMTTGQWALPVLEAVGVDAGLLPKVVQPGTVVGKLRDEVAAELGCPAITVVAVGSHDTASAVAAVPAKADTSWAYLSSGTWSLMGIETPKAIVNDKTFEYDFTNEGGVNGTIRLLKNIMGLWLLQECRRQWQRDGVDLGYGEIAKMATEAKPFVAYIDPDHGAFFEPGDMPAKINAYLKETNQPVLEDKGQMARAILESLALKYRQVMAWLEDVGGKPIDVLHIVGGGIQNELLCQLSADALGKRVVTGPIEATASGNVLMQAMAMGDVADLNEIREVVSNSFEPKTYEPNDTASWDAWEKKVKG